MKYDQSIINYAMYINSLEYGGTVDVTLPVIKYKTVSMTGAGIAGEMEEPVMGHIDPMTCQIKFRNLTREGAIIMAPGQHQIEFRGAREDFDTESGAKIYVPMKYIMVVEALEHNVGTLAPQSGSDGTGTFAVHKFMAFEAGRKFIDIDPANYKHEIDGVDYLAAARYAMGK